MIRAKFVVQRVEQTLYSKKNPYTERYEPVEMRTVVLNPVFDPDPQSENGRFWDASPAGEIKLGTINPAAWEQFTLGQEYYVDFTPADAPAGEKPAI